MVLWQITGIHTYGNLQLLARVSSSSSLSLSLSKLFRNLFRNPLRKSKSREVSQPPGIPSNWIRFLELPGDLNPFPFCVNYRRSVTAALSLRSSSITHPITNHRKSPKFPIGPEKNYFQFKWLIGWIRAFNRRRQWRCRFGRQWPSQPATSYRQCWNSPHPLPCHRYFGATIF